MVIDTDKMFTLIGIGLMCYVVYAIFVRGIWTTTWFNRAVYRERDTDTYSYWESVVIYTLLSIALMTVF